METPLYPTNRESTPPNIHYNTLKIAIDREIRFAITCPEVKKSKGTIVILENDANTLETYFLAINEISQRGFHAAIFDWFGQKKHPSKQDKKPKILL